MHHIPLAFYLDAGETLIVVTNLPFEKSGQYHDLQIVQEHKTGRTGMAIAGEIIEAHGGKVRVENREGEGTTFSFTLKRADVASGKEQ
jgi:light-regulated signal transduction histidine kinase (bacteriophytochrome)